LAPRPATIPSTKGRLTQSQFAELDAHNSEKVPIIPARGDEEGSRVGNAPD
jgi:hypothetical protein